MQLLGIPDNIEKPIIKANGVSIASVMVDQAVGDIATCSFQVPPEFSGAFSSYGEIVTVTVASKSASGIVFKGKLLGRGFSDMTGNINCRVDLAHDVASKLDSSSTLFPGNMPGSAFDNEAYIKPSRKQCTAGQQGGSTMVGLKLTSNFVQDVKTTMLEYINSAASKTGSNMIRPIEVGDAIYAIQRMLPLAGQIADPDSAENGITENLNAILKSSSTSSTFWNTLSQFFGGLDLVMVCKTNGELLVIPNYSGVKADGKNKIPKEWVIQFDQSSKYERTPKKVVVLVSDIPPKPLSGLKNQDIYCGEHELENAPASASGQFCAEAPPFLRSMTMFQNIGKHKQMMDKYAKLIATRETAKFMTCNVTCPLILDVFPGVPVSFEHLSSIKTFSGGSVPGFNKKFDGYVWKISHEISTSGFPKTRFSMTSVTDGAFEKVGSHPFWTGATMPTW